MAQDWGDRIRINVVNNLRNNGYATLFPILQPLD